MLLELHDLDRSLRATGIIPGVTEQRIQPYPKRPALEVRLGRNGQICGLRLLNDDQLQAIRKFECSKGNLRESTPGFNVDPLWRAKDMGQPFGDWLKQWRKAWKSATANPPKCAELLEQRQANCEANWDFSESTKINICLKKAAATLRNELADLTDPRLLALLEILRRSEALDVRSLHDSLADALQTAATTGSVRLTPDDRRKLLYSDREPGSKPATNEGFSLVLELDDASEFGGYPVNHQAVWDALNQHLLAKQVSSASDDTTQSTAAKASGIFGEPLPTKIGSMPERTLPRVGKVKLFSLSAQTPCQSRYKLIESDACPVGPEIQDKLSAALDWVCRPEREGQTWADVSNSCGYKQPALLLAYPSKMSADRIGIAGMFVRRERDFQAVKDSLFEIKAETVVKALNGLVADTPDLAITVVVIAKADKARKKLLYSRQFTARRMIDAAIEWQKAARNIPPISIRTFEEDTPGWRQSPVPFPDQIVRLVNTCWNSEGEQPKTVSNARIGLGLALLLETGPPLAEAVHEALRSLVSNITPLVLALARAHIQNRVAKAATASDIPILAPSILGLLLAKAGHRKGDYMNKNAYLIGRLMGLADEFHKLYCDKERKGDYPPQFIGNALMSTALENPVEGLDRLGDRLLLYIRVADQDEKRGSELRKITGDVERAIDKNNLPTRNSDVEKAQMLLGYLSRPNGEGHT